MTNPILQVLDKLIDLLVVGFGLNKERVDLLSEVAPPLATLGKLVLDVFEGHVGVEGVEAAGAEEGFVFVLAGLIEAKVLSLILGTAVAGRVALPGLRGDAHLKVHVHLSSGSLSKQILLL